MAVGQKDIMGEEKLLNILANISKIPQHCIADVITQKPGLSGSDGKKWCVTKTKEIKKTCKCEPFKFSLWSFAGSYTFSRGNIMKIYSHYYSIHIGW